MPPAGTKRADRAYAHYKWAERYGGQGKPSKAGDHLGRALHYGGDDEALSPPLEKESVPVETRVADLARYAVSYYKGASSDIAQNVAKEIVLSNPHEVSTMATLSVGTSQAQKALDARMRELGYTREAVRKCVRCNRTATEETDTPDGRRWCCDLCAGVARDFMARR